MGVHWVLGILDFCIIALGDMCSLDLLPIYRRESLAEARAFGCRNTTSLVVSGWSGTTAGMASAGREAESVFLVYWALSGRYILNSNFYGSV